ncbi:MAG: phosphotransferase family protein [Deltaproteobacteria bacterium]|nr:phosphotransferase family protein [Myxococcales bacterium]MDP3221453.1 phosphotransferase family protein [Deltaproteobacteria bacterium]
MTEVIRADALPDPLRDELLAAVTATTGLPASLVAARRLAGGASMESWSIDLRVGDADEALVLRRDMGANMSAYALDRPTEFALLQAACAAGVRAPRPRYLSPDGAARRWFLMERLPGESVGRKVVRAPELAAAREVLARQLGEALAVIHAVPVERGLPTIPGPTEGRTPADEALHQARAVLATLGLRNPVWSYALRWLGQRVPAWDGALVLVHGDYRIGNLLVDRDGLAGVLDWEFAHLGDRHEDLAWVTVRDWRFEQDARVVGGVGSLDDYLAGYASAGGRPVDRDAFVWWDLIGNLRWALMCHAQADRHLRGADRSVELLSLGRKAAEMEWELIDRIDAIEKGAR